VPRNPEELARFLAPLTRFLREAVQEAVRTKPEGDLARLRQEWQQTLLPGADEETFADAYAQLVAYGFLLARTLDPGGEPLSLERALELLASYSSTPLTCASTTWPATNEVMPCAACRGHRPLEEVDEPRSGEGGRSDKDHAVC